MTTPVRIPVLTREQGVSRWLPLTAYAVGQPVVNPSGELVTRIAAGVSGATYSAVQWTSPSVTAAAARATYVPSVMLVGPGIDPTGATSSAAGVQALLDTATWGNPKHFMFPPGTFDLDGTPLSLDFSPGTSLRGDSRDTTILTQADGVPHLLFPLENVHSVTVGDMSLTYATPQTNPGSVAVLWHHPGGTFQGWYMHHYADLRVVNAYDGFAVAGADGQQTVWSCTFDRIFFQGIKNRLFGMHPAVTIGMPLNKYRDIVALNTGTGVISTGSAFDLVASEASIDGLDIEGWRNTVVTLTGGAVCELRNVHLEHHVLTDAFSKMFDIANSPFALDQFSISGSATSSDSVVIVQAQTGAAVQVSNGMYGIAVTGTSYIRRFVSSDGSPVSVKRAIKVSGDVGYAGSGTPLSFFVSAIAEPVVGAASFPLAYSSARWLTTERFGTLGAAGVEIGYDVTLPESGTWNLDVLYGKGGGNGIARVYVDGVAVGSTVDTYSGSIVNSVHRITGLALTEGRHRVTVGIVGKNASSASFGLSYSGLQFTRPAV